VKVNRVRDFALYLAIGTIFVILCFVGAVYTDLRSDDVFSRWGGLAVTTALVFGYVLNHTRSMLGKMTAWIAIGCMLVAHLALFAWILRAYSEWRLAWWIAIVPVEYVAVSYILSLLFRRPADHRPSPNTDRHR